MRRRVPSMSALLAFEATAQHLSITRAADQLALTESAVSRQISLLEDQLGIPLFHRVKKRLTLTRAGAAYARDVGRVLAQLEHDTQEVMALEGAEGALEIAVLPTVGSLWLIPRLNDFYALNPTLYVDLSARSHRFLFSETTFDGALCFGSETWPGARSDFLFNEDLVPVASVRLVSPDVPAEPDALAAHRLLHLMTRPDAWQAWAEIAGPTDRNMMKGLRFETQSMLISAACAGQGIALLPPFLIEAQLRSGELRVLSDVSVRSPGAYYFCYPEDSATEPHLIAFRHWLQEQSKLFRSGHPS
ncbi:LysR substrate-binding domain-containing protein [Ottowia thiooxydans]|uniref:LysR substrate-binding domain-containing protein n=1 Tax=Ottowia thiooxydans TaxID=219182 RepID=UPI00040C7F7F|nr:LysR substrate-binding domain-containing protein [Ottowia thiooxydans]